MNNHKPRVSIGLPVYNGMPYIEEAIDLILAQTYSDFELIISDNASTDGTEDICREYASKDKRIRYFRNDKNIGAAKNFNRVFELSSGEYFKWAAHDDLCATSFLSRCIEVLDRRFEIVLCFPKTILIDKGGKVLAMKEDNLIDLNSTEIVARFTKSLHPMKLCHNVIFGLMRRNVLARTRLIGNYLASDRCLVASLSLYGPFYEIPEPLFFRRKHSGNIGTSSKHLEFYDPRLKGRLVLPEWRVCWEHLISVVRAPLNPGCKLLLIGVILRWAVSKRRVLRWELTTALKRIMRAGFLVSFLRRRKVAGN